MGRVSLRKIAVRRAARRVRFLSALFRLEVGGLLPTCTLEACGLKGVSTAFMLLLWARRALRILLENRYLYMSRGCLPNSQQWGWYVIDQLPEHQWRVFMRMSRSTFSHLKDLLSAGLNGSPSRRARRTAIPLDVEMKVALLRLGHDGQQSPSIAPITVGLSGNTT